MDSQSTVVELYNKSPLEFTNEHDKRIYMFDLDSTLVYENIIGGIPEYVVKGIRAIAQYPLVIFTNQLGISKGHCTLDSVVAKIEKFISATGVNPYVYISLADDKYRKPHVGMFKLFVKKYLQMRSADAIATYNMIFCGDAAGRETDFSDSDRKFAINCGIDFVTPEVFFKIRSASDAEEKYEIGGYNPYMYMDSMSRLTPQPNRIALGPCEMIIMVGPPSCGKSSFVTGELSGYVRVNQDTLKTRQKCLRVTKEACMYGLNIVIDNTNPSPSVRKQYIDIALSVHEKYKYNIRCVYMNVPIDFARHLSNYRVELGGKSIPAVAYGIYMKNFEYPTLKEGFSTIDVLDFTPNFTKKQLKKFMRVY
jgi:bifunctional polynucleotide phosphatase/kinase